MKRKIMKFITVTALALCLLVTTVSAAAPSLTAEVNYADGTVDLIYESPLAYPTYVSVIMADAAVADPQPSDYLRMEEFEVDAKGILKASLKLGDLDGEYHIYAIGGGLEADSSYAMTENALLILGEQTVADALEAINAASANDLVATIIEQAGETLQLETSDDDSWRKPYLTGAKDGCYEGEFPSLTAVSNTWKMSTILAAAKKLPAADYPTWLEENNLFLDVDLENEYYAAYTDEVCRILKAQIADDLLLTLEQFQAEFPKICALAVINKAPIAEKKACLEENAELLGVADLMEDYEELDATKVMRQFDNGNLNTIEAFADKLGDVIDEIAANTNDDDDSSGGSGGGGGGGGSRTPSSSVAISGSLAPITPSASVNSVFTDVTVEHWAYTYIVSLKNKGVINGYADGSFLPENPVAREEFVKMLVEAFDLDGEGAQIAFSDVSESDWFYPYIAAGVKNGLIEGKDDGSFGIGEQITRQDMAVIVHRLCVAMGIEIPAGTITFTDGTAISEYAFEGVKALATAGIVNGYEDGSFGPMDPLSRAQAAKVIDSCMKLQ